MVHTRRIRQPQKPIFSPGKNGELEKTHSGREMTGYWSCHLAAAIMVE
jgi:hypothetical protein